VQESRDYGRPLLPVAVYTGKLQHIQTKLWIIAHIWERIARGL
jgi:hypothetical protein